MNLRSFTVRRGRIGWAAGALLCACGHALCADLGADDASRREALVKRSLSALPRNLRKRIDARGTDKVPVLIELLRDRGRPVSVIRPIVEILGHLRDRRSADALGAVLQATSSGSLRRRTVWALGQVKGRKAVGYLTPLLDHEQSVVRQPAATALASALRDPGIEAPGDLLARRAIWLGPAGQAEALRIIDRLSPPRAALGALLIMLSSDRLPTKVARECIKLVGGARYAGMDEAREALRETLRSEDPLVRGEAAVVLARAQLSEEERKEILPEFLEQLASEDRTGKGRALTTRALARVTGEGEGRNAYKWRVWGVKQGYGDPGRPVAPVDRERPAPPASLETGYAGRAPGHSWFYIVIGVVAVTAIAALFILRAVFVARKAAAIESKRRKIRRRSI